MGVSSRDERPAKRPRLTGTCVTSGAVATHLTCGPTPSPVLPRIGGAHVQEALSRALTFFKPHRKLDIICAPLRSPSSWLCSCCAIRLFFTRRNSW